jgi:hypothetical protein
MKDWKWDKFILKNRIWLQPGWSKGSPDLIQETDNAEHPNLTESLPYEHWALGPNKGVGQFFNMSCVTEYS